MSKTVDEAVKDKVASLQGVSGDKVIELLAKRLNDGVCPSDNGLSEFPRENCKQGACLNCWKWSLAHEVSRAMEKEKRDE